MSDYTPRTEKARWKMRDGSWIAPEDMTPQHRENTINMMAGKAYTQAEAVSKEAHSWIGGKYPEAALAQIEDAWDIMANPRAYILNEYSALKRMAELNGEEQ